MRKFWLIAVLLFSTLLVGCAGFQTVGDFLTNIERDEAGEVTNRPDGPAPLDFLGILVPGLAGVAATARWAYTEYAKRKIGQTVKALVAGVEDAVKNKDVSKAALYPAITAASELYANRGFFVFFRFSGRLLRGPLLFLQNEHVRGS